MNEQELFKEKAETNIFVQLLQKYLPFWPLFALTIPISLSVAYVYLKSQTPIYVANAKVLLKDPNKGSGDSKVLDALNIFSEKKIVDNEILVLRSSGLMKEVVSSLDLYATPYNQGKVKLEELYGTNSPVKFVAIEKDSINSYAKYYFQVDWKNKMVHINNQDIHFDSAVVLDNVTFHLQMNYTYNSAVIGKNYFVLIRPLEATAGEIIGSLRASPLSNVSTVLDVKLESPEPNKARDILTKLFEVYNSEGIEDKNQIAKKTLNFIDDRLRLVEHQLDSVERGIQSYKSGQSLYNIGSQAEEYFSKVQDLDKRSGEADLQLDILNDIRNYVLNKGKRPGTVPSLSLVDDKILIDLLTNLYAAEFESDKVRAVAGDQSEAVILANDKVSIIKS